MMLAFPIPPPPRPRLVLLGAAFRDRVRAARLWPLTLACLAIWMWLVHEAPTLKAALCADVLFGVGHFTVNDNWFQHAFDFQDKMPPVLGYVGVIPLALYLAVYPVLAAGLAWRFAARYKRAGLRGRLCACLRRRVDRDRMAARRACSPAIRGIRSGLIWVPRAADRRARARSAPMRCRGWRSLVAGALLLRRRRCDMPASRRSGAGRSRHAFKLPAPTRPVARHAPTAVSASSSPISARKAADADDAEVLAKLTAMSGAPGAAPRLIVWPEGAIDALDRGRLSGSLIGRAIPCLR